MLADLRLNPHYVMWYKNLATMVVTLLIPLILLGFWNFKTFSVMQRRSRLKNRPLNNIEDTHDRSTVSIEGNPFIPPLNNRSAIQAKADEARKAKVLFAIVFLFLVCNIPRIILNLEESFNVFSKNYYLILYRDNKGKKPCYSTPYWTLILNCFSQLLVTINASICSVVYCIMCSLFRSEMVDTMKAMKSMVTFQATRLYRYGKMSFQRSIFYPETQNEGDIGGNNGAERNEHNVSIHIHAEDSHCHIVDPFPSTGSSISAPSSTTPEQG